MTWYIIDCKADKFGTSVIADDLAAACYCYLSLCLWLSLGLFLCLYLRLLYLCLCLICRPLRRFICSYAWVVRSSVCVCYILGFVSPSASAFAVFVPIFGLSALLLLYVWLCLGCLLLCLYLLCAWVCFSIYVYVCYIFVPVPDLLASPSASIVLVTVSKSSAPLSVLAVCTVSGSFTYIF